MSAARRLFPRPKVSGESHRVTTFELLFDLVFVFAFTQITESMSHAHSAIGVLEGMVILGILWWGWASYAWLANQTHVDEGVVRLGMSAAMAAMFVLALAIPGAFERSEAGLSAALVLVVAYFVVRAIHVVLYLLAAGEDRALGRQVLVTETGLIVSISLLLAGALIGGRPQLWFWVGGLAADVVLTYLTSNGGDWRLPSPAHWAERHGLVVMLALGESIVAIGVGAEHGPIVVPVIAAVLLAIVLTISLWWLYFDLTAIAAERELVAKAGTERVALATDAYTYLHLPLIAGILLSALGVEQAIAHLMDHERLDLFSACALFGGTALYLAAHAAFWRRVGGAWKVFRLAGGTALLALIPLAVLLPPLLDLGVVAAVVAVVAAIETLRYSDRRAALRAADD